jgi:DNA-binding transcriptional MerR regulator
MKSKLIAAKELIQKYNLTYQTVNHYTNLGLFDVVTKRGNVRLYDEAVIAGRMSKITQYINAGLPLRLIRKALNDELAVKIPGNGGGAA